MIDKITSHIERHKGEYCVGIVAGITCYIMRGRIVALGYAGANGLETADTLVTNRSLFSFFSPHDIKTVIVREGRGHPGYLIRNVNTNQYFPSQRAAAKFLGIDEMTVSRHLNGKLSHVVGNRLERVALTRS